MNINHSTRISDASTVNSDQGLLLDHPIIVLHVALYTCILQGPCNDIRTCVSTGVGRPAFSGEVFILSISAVSTRTRTCTHIHTHAHGMYTHAHTRMHTCMHTCTHTHTHTNKHTQTNTHKHTHTQSQCTERITSSNHCTYTTN